MGETAVPLAVASLPTQSVGYLPGPCLPLTRTPCPLPETGTRSTKQPSCLQIEATRPRTWTSLPWKRSGCAVSSETSSSTAPESVLVDAAVVDTVAGSSAVELEEDAASDAAGLSEQPSAARARRPQVTFDGFMSPPTLSLVPKGH
ncbi:MAG: hypothetical protein HY744_21845 [Deltaproteobacteria bacterium]|nr:hypothetical protein [Deltaproteobacteria bacterium]